MQRVHVGRFNDSLGQSHGTSRLFHLGAQGHSAKELLLAWTYRQKRSQKLHDGS
jgi:hypothetical protein